MITAAKFLEKICETSIGVCFDYIKVTKDRRKLRKKVNKFAESVFESQFKQLDLTSEIDFIGLSNYLKSSLMNGIENYIASPSDTVKEALIAKACNAANANIRNKKAIVETFVESVIIIMKQDFIGNVDKSLMIFAHDLTGTLFNDIKKEMDINTNEILKEIAKLDANEKEIIAGGTVQENELRKINRKLDEILPVIKQQYHDNTASNVSIQNPLDLLRDFGVSASTNDSVVTAVKYSSKNDTMKIRFCVKRKGRIAEFDTTDEYLADLNYTMVEDTVEVVSSVIIQQGKKTEHNSDENFTGATCYLPWLYFTEMEVYSLGLNNFTNSKFVSGELTIVPKQLQVSYNIEKSDRSILWQGLKYKLRRSIENNNRCCYYENEVGNSRIKMNVKFSFETIFQDGESTIISPYPVIDFSVTPVDSCNARSLLESYQALLNIYSTDVLRFVDSKTRELYFSVGVKVNNLNEQEIRNIIEIYNKIIDIEEYFNFEFKLKFPMENDVLWHISMIHDLIKNKKANRNYSSLSLTTHLTLNNMDMKIGNSCGWVMQVKICKQLFDKEMPIENVVMICPNTKYASQNGDIATLEIIGEVTYFWDVEDKIYSNLDKGFNEILESAGIEHPHQL